MACGDYLIKTYKTIKIERNLNTIWIILNRPNQLNIIDNAFLSEFSQVLDEVENDPAIRCVVITGKGDKAFSAGADITSLAGLTPKQAEEFSKTGQKIFSKIEKMPKPVVAAINGLALGGGLELALACDLIVAAKHAQLGSPEVTLGLIPAWGGTQRLVRTVGLAKAKELIMLGKRINANDALQTGLVYKVVPYSKLQEEVKELAAQFYEKAPLAIKYAKYALNFGAKAFLEEGLQIENRFTGLLASSEDFKEGLDAFLSKRKAEFKAT